MKTLYSILEGQTIKKLPFSLQEFTAIDQKLLDYNEPDPAVQSILHKVEIAYGNKVCQFFKNILFDSYVVLRDAGMTPEEFYNGIQSLSQHTLDRLMGLGSNGIVFDLGDRVIKYFMHGAKSEDLKFYQYCQTHKESYLPKVYRISQRYVILEKLITNTKEIEYYDNLIYSRFKGPGYNMAWWHMVTGGKYVGTYNTKINSFKCWNKREEKELKLALKAFKDIRLTPKEQQVAAWVNNVAKMLWDVCELYPMADVRTANMGQRSNGDIVVFDI